MGKMSENALAVGLVQKEVVSKVDDTVRANTEFSNTLDFVNNSIRSFEILSKRKYNTIIILHTLKNLPENTPTIINSESSQLFLKSSQTQQRDNLENQLGLLSDLQDRNLSEIQETNQTLSQTGTPTESINQLTQKYPVIRRDRLPDTQSILGMITEVTAQIDVLRQVIVELNNSSKLANNTISEVNKELSDKASEDSQLNREMRKESSARNRGVLTQLKDAIELIINNTTSNRDGKSLWNRISSTVSVAKGKIKGVKNSKSNMGVLDSVYREIAWPAQEVANS